MKKHVHAYQTINTRSWDRKSTQAKCSVCGHKERLEDLVYLGDAPKSVGNGTTSTVGVR